METNHLLSVIIFAPLAGALVNWFIGRRLRNEKFIALVACGAVGLSTLVAFYLALKSDGALRSEQPILDHLWTWIQVGRFRADFALAMDRLSGIYALFVTFVGFLIHVFAVGYMHEDRGFYRFFAYLNLFMFAMLTLVLADNFLLMFVGWEGVGLCSYLLIGFYTDLKEAGDAAKKAFITNRVGDWGFILGVMLVFFITSAAGNASISFFDKPAHGVSSALQTIAGMSVDPFTWHAFFAGGLTSVALLLFIGAAGKSAQIPLYVWLPDAMAGPTPVSALIHAATMVTAGVFLVARTHALFEASSAAAAVVVVTGALTALLAAVLAIGQDDIKRILAYSTVSQLGYMFIAVGLGPVGYVAGIFHLVTHAVFKAQLFLGAGSVMHGNDGSTDVKELGGLRRAMPLTFVTTMAAWLAIIGFPLTAGFYSKDQILDAAFEHGGVGVLAWVVGVLTAGLTGFYMSRLVFLTFFGERRWPEGRHPHESPPVMTVPLVVLGLLALVGGFTL